MIASIPWPQSVLIYYILYTIYWDISLCHQVGRSSKAPKDRNAFIFRDWQSKKTKIPGHLESQREGDTIVRNVGNCLPNNTAQPDFNLQTYRRAKLTNSGKFQSSNITDCLYIRQFRHLSFRMSVVLFKRSALTSTNQLTRNSVS